MIEKFLNHDIAIIRYNQYLDPILVVRMYEWHDLCHFIVPFYLDQLKLSLRHSVYFLIIVTNATVNFIETINIPLLIPFDFNFTNYQTARSIPLTRVSMIDNIFLIEPKNEIGRIVDIIYLFKIIEFAREWIPSGDPVVLIKCQKLILNFVNGKISVSRAHTNEADSGPMERGYNMDHVIVLHVNTSLVIFAKIYKVLVWCNGGLDINKPKILIFFKAKQTFDAE